MGSFPGPARLLLSEHLQPLQRTADPCPASRTYLLRDDDIGRVVVLRSPEWNPSASSFLVFVLGPRSRMAGRFDQTRMAHIVSQRHGRHTLCACSGLGVRFREAHPKLLQRKAIRDSVLDEETSPNGLANSPAALTSECVGGTAEREPPRRRQVFRTVPACPSS